MSASAPRLLLARPDHLGDLLLSLPAAVWLRAAVPNVRITALVPQALAPIAQRCPAIDATLTARFPPPETGAVPDGWRMTLAKFARMRDRFDVALLPRIDDPWSGALSAAADIPSRIGFDHPQTRNHLTTALVVPPHLHVTRLALLVAGAAVDGLRLSERHITALPETPWIVPTDADHREAQAVLDADNIRGDGPLIALHPGAGWPLKSWPVERWGQLARRVEQVYRVRPLITGGATEQAMIASIVEESAGAAVSLAASLSLGGLAALYARASAVIAIDSGPLHLAAAVGTPVVGIYGPAGIDEFGPWVPAERQRVVHVRLPCSPCRTLSSPPCGALSQPACLRAVQVEAVVTALGELLGIPS